MKSCGRLAFGLILYMTFRLNTWACPVCFGANDSPMAAGMNTAILVMLGIIGFVLSMILTFFLIMWRRYKHEKSVLSDRTFIDDRGNLQMKNEKGVVEWNNF
ncbi:MAG: hypothetical protein HYR76_02105 [Ignavibacteria bacterium]|nr:hypothetical protein [Ignavibacteria bacterium]MBI3765088.1 hypothetical protein [Ignavibacteriales bacterium]